MAPKCRDRHMWVLEQKAVEFHAGVSLAPAGSCQCYCIMPHCDYNTSRCSLLLCGHSKGFGKVLSQEASECMLTRIILEEASRIPKLNINCSLTCVQTYPQPWGCWAVLAVTTTNNNHTAAVLLFHLVPRPQQPKLSSLKGNPLVSGRHNQCFEGNVHFELHYKLASWKSQSGLGRKVFIRHLWPPLSFFKFILIAHMNEQGDNLSYSVHDYKNMGRAAPGQTMNHVSCL